MDKPSEDGFSADCWSSSVGRLDAHHSSGVANQFYAGARTATLSAAKDLYGSTSTEYKTVAAAWSAVSVN